MKKTVIHTWLTLVAVLVFTACSIDEIDTFGSDTYVYFPIENVRLETIDDNGFLEKNYTFIFEGDQHITEKIYSLPVKIAGLPQNSDQEISIEVVDSLSSAKEGVHYELLPASHSVVPAGSVEGSIQIKLLKTAGMDENTFNLAIKIVDSGNLKAGPQNASIIHYSNYLMKPAWWNSWFLGDFTIKKCVLWLEFMGITDGSDPWAVEPYIFWGENSDGEIIPVNNDTTRKQSVQMFVLWLDEGDENGQPYIDENGNKVIDTI